MKLIPYERFSQLRLANFLPAAAHITEHGGFEWMGGTWRYEGIGFTWFGQLEDNPEGTGGIELYFEELSEVASSSILHAIGLPLAAGIGTEQLNAILGPNFQTVRFVDDRVSHVFRLGEPDVYEVSCTVSNEQGLVHVSIIRNDLRRALAVA
ncbi:MAG: hypothetical protein AB7P31_12750 [Steroidobacteraceae bacterium]